MTIERSVPAPFLDPPRYAPTVPFPVYRYVPRLTPHPIRHEGGHLRGRTRTSEPFAGTDWATHEGYLHACDLYNHGYFWEAHELWEELWRGLVRSDASRLVLQALIQVSAAHLKLIMKDMAGAGKLAARGLEKLARLPRTPPVRLGLDVAGFEADARRYFDAIASGGPTGRVPRWPALRLDRSPSGVPVDQRDETDREDRALSDETSVPREDA